jgi:hypothetical protein
MLANRTEAGSAASRYPIPLYSFFLYDSNLFVRKAVHMVNSFIDDLFMLGDSSGIT